MSNKELSLLSLCKRAAKLVLGHDKVVETIDSHTAEGVFLAADLSEKSKKEAEFLCGKHHVKVTELTATMDEIKAAVGKRSGMMSITDKGLSDNLLSLLTREHHDANETHTEPAGSPGKS